MDKQFSQIRNNTIKIKVKFLTSDFKKTFLFAAEKSCFRKKLFPKKIWIFTITTPISTDMLRKIGLAKVNKTIELKNMVKYFSVKKCRIKKRSKAQLQLPIYTLGFLLGLQFEVLKLVTSTNVSNLKMLNAVGIHKQQVVTSLNLHFWMLPIFP